MLRASRSIWPLILTGALLTAELLIKSWATQNLPGQAPQTVVPGLLSLTYTLNQGMAWGLLDQLTRPLALLRLLVGIALMVNLARGGHPVPRSLALSFIAAGALSNATDGLTQGAVVDYLSSPFLDTLHRVLNGQNFPIFNGADVLVLAGIVLLFLTLPRTRPRGASQETL